MENQIIKPVTMIRAEFISDLTNLINNSTLPAFIIESIIKDVYTDIRIVAQKQLEADKLRYEQELLKLQSQSKESGG